MNIASITPATSPEHHRFHMLDALRGVAAILVMTRHVFPAYKQVFFRPLSYLAVDFFFCLSGFVVAFSYERRLLSSMNLASFSLIRLLRLYPLAALGMILGLCELLIVPRTGNHLWTGPPTFFRVLAGFALIPCPDVPPYLLFPISPVLWSLLMEVIANVAYAISIRLGLLKDWVLVAVTVLCLVLLRADMLRFFNLDVGVTKAGLSLAVMRVASSFCLGVATMRLYRRTSQHRITGSLATASCLLAVAILTNTLLFRNVHKNTLLFIVAVLFPGLIYFSAHISVPSSLRSTCVFLGKISYPLYILHLPIVFTFFSIPALIHLSDTHQVIANSLLVLFFAFLTLVSWVAAEFYDTPIRTFLTARLNGLWPTFINPVRSVNS